VTPEEIHERIKVLERKLLASNDPDVSAAFEQSIAALKKLLPNASADNAPETEDDWVPPTPAQVDQAEQLIRRARLEQSRGHSQAARQLLDEAQAAAPGSPVVLEAIADAMIERRKYSTAREVLAQAVRRDPKNSALERKYADAILMSQGALFSDPATALAHQDSLLPTNAETLANAKIAPLLSTMLPGMGQFVLGQTRAGAVYLGGWFAMIVWIAIQLQDFKGLLGMFGLNTGVSRPDNLAVLIPVFLAGGFHLTSMFQCATLAKRIEPKTKSRPKPLVDLPFE
jgi:tetratricopeptide (TPR) repeat protein